MRFFTVGKGSSHYVPASNRGTIPIQGKDGKGKPFTFRTLPKWLWGGGSCFRDYGTRFSRSHNVDIGSKRNRTSTHQGVDLQPLETNGNWRNAVIIWPMAAPGVVVAKGYSNSIGYWIHIRPAPHLFKLDHNEEEAIIFQMYHLKSIAVQKGDLVIQGTILGEQGNTGTQSSGEHLHLQIWTEKQPKEYFDPFHALFTKLNVEPKTNLRELSFATKNNAVDWYERFNLAWFASNQGKSPIDTPILHPLLQGVKDSQVFQASRFLHLPVPGFLDKLCEQLYISAVAMARLSLKPRAVSFAKWADWAQVAKLNYPWQERAVINGLAVMLRNIPPDYRSPYNKFWIAQLERIGNGRPADPTTFDETNYNAYASLFDLLLMFATRMAAMKMEHFVEQYPKAAANTLDSTIVRPVNTPIHEPSPESKRKKRSQKLVKVYPVPSRNPEGQLYPQSQDRAPQTDFEIVTWPERDVRIVYVPTPIPPVPPVPPQKPSQPKTLEYVDKPNNWEYAIALGIPLVGLAMAITYMNKD